MHQSSGPIFPIITPLTQNLSGTNKPTQTVMEMATAMIWSTLFAGGPDGGTEFRSMMSNTRARYIGYSLVDVGCALGFDG